MKRFAALTGMVALLMGFGLVLAEDHGGGPPVHGHFLLLGLEGAVFDENGRLSDFDDFRKCVDLAGGRALRNNAHHNNIHTGNGGAALLRAGHVVIPTGPLTPLSCAALNEAFGK